MKTFRRPLSSLAAATLALVLVACSSDDGADNAPDNAANSAASQSADSAAADTSSDDSATDSAPADDTAPADPAADETDAAEEPASGEPRVVQTDQGEVTVPADPQRILVLNSALTGYLYAMDIPVLGSIPRDLSDTEFPALWAAEAQADGTEQLEWNEDGFDLEEILSLEPDLIVAGGVGYPNSMAVKVYDQLTEIAPTVVVSNTLYTWQDQLHFLADDVFGKPEAGQKLLDSYDTRVAEVKAAITLPPTPVGYLLMLADGTPYSIPENSDLSVALEAVGLTADKVAENNPEFEMFGSGDTFELSTEQVGQVITQPTVFVLGFNADLADLDAMKANPVYNELPAFKADQVYELSFTAFRADYYAAMALLDTVEELFG